MAGSIAQEVGEAVKREALRRVLASNTFHRTDQLKSLLRYVCEREISGSGASLDEYAVAVEALGRPSGYSSFADGTVRNRVHNLRRRLEIYYSAENPEDPVAIVLPKGSYCPTFEWRSVGADAAPVVDPTGPERAALQPLVAESAALERAPQVEAPVTNPWDRPVKLRTVCLICAVCLAVALAGSWIRKDRGGIDPVVAEAWGPLVARNSNALLCLATAAQLTLIQRPVEPAAGPTINSPDLLAWYQGLKGLPPAKEIYLGPSLTSPFWGDVAGAFAASQVLSAAGASFEALPEPAVQLPALNKRNLLIFGRPGFSKTIDLYLDGKPFRIPIPDSRHWTTIQNVNPKPGERREYDGVAESRAANREIAYGLITVMPSWGNANLRTVIFSGTLSPGTQAATEFFSSAKQLRRLKELLRKEGYSGFPPSYQVIVRSNVFGTSALDVQYVTHRVL